MLGSNNLVAFIPTRDPKRAKQFYRTVLGLRFVSADDFAVVMDANGTMLRITDVSTVPQFKPDPFTVLGWEVDDITRVVKSLGAAGVTFERYPGMTQDQYGVWTAPGGSKVAWFKDPDGNVLSVSEH